MSGTGADARAAAPAGPALLLSEQPMGWLHYRIVALCSSPGFSTSMTSSFTRS
jgi:hypothetical protein